MIPRIPITFGYTPCDNAPSIQCTERDLQDNLTIACKDGKVRCVQRILKSAPGLNSALLTYGAQVRTKDSDEWAALTWAVRAGNIEIVKLLLDRGANIEAQDSDEWTALTWAVRAGNIEIVKLLLDRGANIEAQDDAGRTALMWAVKTGNIEIVKLLLDRGANIEAQDDAGRTALMWAVKTGNIEIVKLLLDRGANMETQDSDEWTALMWAVKTDNIEIVKLLLDRGANIEAQDDDGYTALLWAANKGYTEIVKALLDSGANTGAIDNDGICALRVLRERSFPGYKQIKTRGTSVPVLKDYNKFYGIVNLVCQIYGFQGKSRFKAHQRDIVFERLGVHGNYYSSVFAKNLLLFSEKITDKAVQEALSRICRMLEGHAVSEFVSSDELAQRYAQGTPILVSGGFDGHVAVYCFWHTYCILANRGDKSRKSIEIFPIEEKARTDPDILGGLLSEIRRIENDGADTEFGEFVNNEFQKPYYLPQTALELRLEEVLALPAQTVGNCAFTSTEGIVFALLVLEALRAGEGLVSHGESDEMYQEKIQEIVESQRKIFGEFSGFLRARYREKYLTQLPPERRECDIFLPLLTMRH